MLAIPMYFADDEYMKNNSPYARRYIPKYREYHLKKLAEEEAQKAEAQKTEAQD